MEGVRNGKLKQRMDLSGWNEHADRSIFCLKRSYGGYDTGKIRKDDKYFKSIRSLFVEDHDTEKISSCSKG